MSERLLRGFVPVFVLFVLMLPVSGCMGERVRSMGDGLTLQSRYKADDTGKKSVGKAGDESSGDTAADNTVGSAGNTAENSQENNQENSQNINNQNIYESVKWWTLYDDPDLNELITHAFSNSPSLGMIRARLDQAGALKDKFSSTLWPSLNVTAKRQTYDSGASHVDSGFNLSGAASYEIDLWRKNRATSDAYALKERASREDLHSAAITLSANIVDLWLKVLALVEQEAVLRKQIETNQTIYDLVKKRFEMGSARAFDVLQQEEAVNSSKAGLPDILSAQAQAVNALSLLIGEVPSNAITLHAKPLPEPLPMAKAGLPSTLMQNRPDIVAAWLRLLSSDKAVNVAKANRLPSFDLSALYTAGGTKLSNIFDRWLLTLAGGIAAPIVDGGALSAEQHYREAISDEAFQAYRETVLRAVKDVEDALVSNRFQDRKIIMLKEQLRAARDTLKQARVSYANGQGTYVNVLRNVTIVQSLEMRLISERLAQAQMRVSLYRALGGQGWSDVIPTVTTLISYPPNKENNPQTPQLNGEKMERDGEKMEKKQL